MKNYLRISSVSSLLNGGSLFKRCLVYVVLPFLSIAAFAAEPGQPAIRSALQKFVDAQDISGAVTVVATKDKILDLDAIGLADIAQKETHGAR